MTIQHSNNNDIEKIFALYKKASEYQKTHFPDNTWSVFKRKLIETEIEEKRQFKIVIDQKIACIWAITFTDPQIWGEKDKDAAIYIHRIATNPDFRGQNFVLKIVEWAKKYALSKNKLYVRMDTGGNNKKLIQHYTKCGFTFLGLAKLTNSKDLPLHYKDAELCYFEIKL